MAGSQHEATGSFRTYAALTSTTYGSTTASTIHVDFDLSYTNPIFSGNEVKPKSISVLVLLRL